MALCGVGCKCTCVCVFFLGVRACVCFYKKQLRWWDDICSMARHRFMLVSTRKIQHWRYVSFCFVFLPCSNFSWLCFLLWPSVHLLYIFSVAEISSEISVTHSPLGLFLLTVCVWLPTFLSLIWMSVFQRGFLFVHGPPPSRPIALWCHDFIALTCCLHIISYEWYEKIK